MEIHHLFHPKIIKERRISFINSEAATRADGIPIACYHYINLHTMNRIIIFAAAGAALATYLISRRRSLRSIPDPIVNNPSKSPKHLTTVFSRAKRQSQNDE